MLFEATVAAVVGLAVGSAINAMVWRLYVGRSWVHGRSVCPECEHVLGAADLIPVVSWLALRGKCRYCKAPIKDHPVVELATACAFILSAVGLTHSTNADLVRIGFWFVMLTMLLVLAVYDARWLILPDKVMLPLIVLAFVYAGTMAIMMKSPQQIVQYVLAAMLAGGAFYAIVFFSRGRAMGGGDIKLAFAMGLMLGAQNTAVALFFAFNLAAIVGIAMVVAGRRSRKDQIPFGPFLVTATVVAFIFGNTIVAWYLRLNGLA